MSSAVEDDVPEEVGRRSARVLFVDDETHVLEGLREGLRRNSDRWEMSFAASGEEALRVFEEEPFDVVVSDVDMPGMDGATLLERLRTQRPSTGRIVLSGPLEPSAALQVASFAHQCLSKPCNRGALERAIESSLRLSLAPMNPMLKSLVGGAARLPSAPSTYFELSAAMRDPDVPYERLAKAVEKDPGLTAKILKLLSSPVFGLKYQVSRVAQGFSLLGLETIRSLVLGEEVVAAFKALPAGARLATEAHHDHAIATARVAAALAGKGQSADAFTSGLLHDVGVLLVAASVPDELFEILDEATEAGVPPHVMERQRWGITHAEIGAHLLGLWGLPSQIVQAVADHHDPLPWVSSVPSLGTLICAADALVREVLHEVPRLDEARTHALCLVDVLPEWRLKARSVLEGAGA